ncbi:MAG: hypothetical protein FWE37_08355 [Spirochaetaceae bacterium]|nr:hypothetical protein [Spirochaetaceae bacterium]
MEKVITITKIVFKILANDLCKEDWGGKKMTINKDKPASGVTSETTSPNKNLVTSINSGTSISAKSSNNVEAMTVAAMVIIDKIRNFFIKISLIH